MMSYQELLDFMDMQEMTPILCAVICGDCDADDCDDCPGHDIMGEVDDQICGAGLELMKILAKEWGDSQKQRSEEES